MIDLLFEMLHKYGFAAIIIAIFLEYACFPVSSEIILPFAGAFACTENINPFIFLPLSILAGLTGTSVCYLAGVLGGRRIIIFLTEHFPKSEKAIHSSEAYFKKYGSSAVCFGRLIPLCRTYIAFVAGACGQSYSNFASFSFLGISIWNSLLIGAGYFMKSRWSDVSGIYQEYKIVILTLLAFLITALIIWKITKHIKKGR